MFRATRAGFRMSGVCEAAGIDPRTAQRWARLAEEQPNSPQAAFVATLKALRRRGQIDRMEKIEAHGDEEWTALAWLNERTNQEELALQKDKGETGPRLEIVKVEAGAITVTFASGPALPAAAPVNVIDIYQTQSLSEGQSAQALAAPYSSATEAKGEGRKSLTPQPAPAHALPAASRGHGLTEPGSVGGGVPPDGSGISKASRRRGRKEKKGLA